MSESDDEKRGARSEPATVDELQVAELEAKARAATAVREDLGRPRSGSMREIMLSSPSRVRETEAKADLDAALARAALEKQKREAADAATTALIEANRRMAEASEAAARASADAARWAKWAAIFTAVAAGVTLAVAVIEHVRGK